MGGRLVQRRQRAQQIRPDPSCTLLGDELRAALLRRCQTLRSRAVPDRDPVELCPRALGSERSAELAEDGVHFLERRAALTPCLGHSLRGLRLVSAYCPSTDCEHRDVHVSL